MQRLRVCRGTDIELFEEQCIELGSRFRDECEKKSKARNNLIMHVSCQFPILFPPVSLLSLACQLMLVGKLPTDSTQSSDVN